MASSGKDSDQAGVHRSRPLLSDEEVIDSHLRSFAKVERLAPEEEAYHTQRFFESRENLGALLSHFPILIGRKIRECKTTQIQEFDDQGHLDQSLIDEKKKHILSLISGLEAVAEHLGGIALDTTDEAVATRAALHRSLERLLGRFLFHCSFYTECCAELEECSNQLTDTATADSLLREIVRMPHDQFTETLKHIRLNLKEMEASRDLLLEANLKLVVGIARKYTKYGMNYQDLFQEGYLGMAVALDKFQPSRGHRFSTYAVWWIRQGITQALSSQSRTIRIPANMARFVSQIKRTEQVLLQKLGREPTTEDIAEHMEQPVERVRAWQKIERQPISLESPIKDSEGTSSVSDLVSDATAKQPDEVVSSRLLREAISEVLTTLNEREQTIIKHRFGLLGKSVMTLEELSKRFNVSHERIRQIEVAALKKLKSPDRRKYFDGYY